MAKAKTGDDNALTIRANTALAIASEVKAIYDTVIVNDGEITEEQYEALKQWQAALEVKAENIAHVSAKFDADEEYYRKLEEIVKAKRKSCENARERLRKYLALCMKEANIKNIKKKEGGIYSISLVEGRLKAVIDDMGVLPLNYCTTRVEYDPDNARIKSALEDGREIPGAHLERGEHYITIR